MEGQVGDDGDAGGLVVLRPATRMVLGVPPAWNSRPGTTWDPPCEDRIPAGKTLPGSRWAKLGLEEGQLERDAGLVGPGGVSGVSLGRAGGLEQAHGLRPLLARAPLPGQRPAGLALLRLPGLAGLLLTGCRGLALERLTSPCRSRLGGAPAPVAQHFHFGAARGFEV